MARVSCQYSISAAPSTTAMAAYTQTEPAISVDDLAAAAVVDGDVKHGPGADAGMFAGLTHLFLQGRRQLLNAAGEPQLDSTPSQLLHFSANGLGKEAHQGVHLIAWA